jgi:hypothetical protein
VRRQFGDGPVRDPASPIFIRIPSAKITAQTGSRDPRLPLGYALATRSVIAVGVWPRDLGTADVGQVHADLPVRQPLRRQGDHHVIHPGQPPLALRDDPRSKMATRSRGTLTSTGPRRQSGQTWSSGWAWAWWAMPQVSRAPGD